MAAPDRFAGAAASDVNLQNPLTRGVNVTPNNSADLSFRPRAIHVGGTAGDVKMDVEDPAGTVTQITTFLEVGWHPIRPHRIYATGTVATDISAWD